MKTARARRVGDWVLYKGDRCQIVAIVAGGEYVCSNLDNHGYEVWLTEALLEAGR